MGVPYFETSAKNGGGVEEAFQSIINIIVEVVKKNEKRKLQEEGEALKKSKPEEIQTGGCRC